MKAEVEAGGREVWRGARVRHVLLVQHTQKHVWRPTLMVVSEALLGFLGR